MVRTTRSGREFSGIFARRSRTNRNRETQRARVRTHIRQTAPDMGMFPLGYSRNLVFHHGHTHPAGKYNSKDECHRHRNEDSQPKTEQVHSYKRRVA